MAFINSCTDNFIDKLLSLPLNMNGSKFTQGTSLCLISNSPNFCPPHTEEELLNDFFQSGVSSHLVDNNYMQRIKESYIGNLSYNFFGSNKFVSPYVTDFVQTTIRFLNSRSDMWVSPNSLNISNMFNDIFVDPEFKKLTYSNPKIDTVDKQLDIASVKEPNEFSLDPELQPTYSNTKTDSVDKQLDIASVKEPKITMSVTVQNISQKEISNMGNNKCNVPNGVTLNLELASRKTKELQKRSKKRRRRQKKIQCTVAKSSPSNLEDKVDSCKKSSPISSRVCFSSSPNDEPGFVVKVKREIEMVPNFVSSFLISVENGSDDSDWDSCTESDILTETDEFELTGLVLTSRNMPTVCSTPYSFNVEMNLTTFCQDLEDQEMCEFQAALLQVNKKWNESTKGLRTKLKSTPKVSFAPDDQLVEVFPVEIYERKGEWETYGIERLRFKRRIDELAKVILPCLAAEHRLEVYRNVIEPTL